MDVVAALQTRIFMTWRTYGSHLCTMKFHISPEIVTVNLGRSGVYSAVRRFENSLQGGFSRVVQFSEV
jgi:hypothetical protein